MTTLTESFLEQLDTEFDSEVDSPFDEDERAVAILTNCVKLYKSTILGAVLSVKQETLKEVSELFGVPATLVYHAVELGPRNAHTSYKAGEMPQQPVQLSQAAAQAVRVAEAAFPASAEEEGKSAD